jgi:acetyl esterase/lipase
MRAWVVGFLAFSAAVDAIAAQGGAAERPLIAETPVLEDRYPRNVVDFGVVEGLPDLVFTTVPGFRPLRLDLYRPKTKASRGRPLVIYIHGGGWQGGHTRHSGAFANWPGVLASLAAQGYVVASIEYRLSGEAPFPAAFDDVKAALQWLRSQAAVYGIDPSRAVIWGGSAGGHLAALTAVTCESNQTGSVKDAASRCVQGFVAWYGIFDMAGILEAEGARAANAPSAGSRFLACEKRRCDPKLVASASPIVHVDTNDPPSLLIHGRGDAVVNVDQSVRFHETLHARGVASTLKIIDGVDHSFIGATPQQTRDASIEALDATFKFIAATIGDRK